MQCCYIMPVLCLLCHKVWHESEEREVLLTLSAPRNCSSKIPPQITVLISIKKLVLEKKLKQ